MGIVRGLGGPGCPVPRQGQGAARPDGVWYHWDVVDHRQGEITIEVKSSAYIQGWGERALTRICFGPLVKLVWDGATGAWIGEPQLNADWYVFALEICRDGPAYNPHDLAQWRFYVVSRGALEGLKKGKGLSLARVAALATPMTAEELRRDGTAMMGLQTRP